MENLPLGLNEFIGSARRPVHGFIESAEDEEVHAGNPQRASMLLAVPGNNPGAVHARVGEAGYKAFELRGVLNMTYANMGSRAETDTPQLGRRTYGFHGICTGYLIRGKLRCLDQG